MKKSGGIGTIATIVVVIFITAVPPFFVPRVRGVEGK
jgi:hypothetical protein